MGEDGLKEISRAPLSHPNATPDELVANIVAIKYRHTRWGPRKIIAWLRHHYPDKKWPADSTTCQILKRNGLVKAHKDRHRVPPYSEPFLGCDRPNAVWSADFKGQFRMGDS